MISPVPAGVRQDLIGFFKGESVNPDAINGPHVNVRKELGLENDLLGWRGLTGPINALSSISGVLRIDPVQMDVCTTIAHIEAKLRRIQVAAARRSVTGRATAKSHKRKSGKKKRKQVKKKAKKAKRRTKKKRTGTKGRKR